MFLRRYFHDIIIAFEAILANKLKSVLTALGIIFGVGAVISMLAIGTGAQQEILEQIMANSWKFGKNILTTLGTTYSLYGTQTIHHHDVRSWSN